MSNRTALSFEPAFVRIKDVLRITTLSRATLYRRISEGRFPAPVHFGGRACGWSTAALQEWIHDPERYSVPASNSTSAVHARGRPRKAGNAGMR